MTPEHADQKLRHWLLTLLAFGSASVSLLALVLHAMNWLPLYFLVDIVAAPSLVLLLVLGVIAYRIQEPVFLSRLLTGSWVGLVATGAYDLIRFLLRASGIISFDPFLSHPVFGRLITGLPETTQTAVVVGWAYHFWNGFGLGLMYTLLLGNVRWYYAMVWATLLEFAWLVTLPSVLQLKVSPAFIVVGFIGHAAYGAVLGVLVERFAKA